MGRGARALGKETAVANITIKCEPIQVNLSPVGFAIWAKDYFGAYLAYFKAYGTKEFSSVPFFLCCRAIELALKARHLETLTQNDVKNLFSHDLEKSYRQLPPAQRDLTPEELDLLIKSNQIYKDKHFEYLNVFDACTAYKRFPDIEELGVLARRITAYDV